MVDIVENRLAGAAVPEEMTVEAAGEIEYLVVAEMGPAFTLYAVEDSEGPLVVLVGAIGLDYAVVTESSAKLS